MNCETESSVEPFSGKELIVLCGAWSPNVSQETCLYRLVKRKDFEKGCEITQV